MEQLVPGIVLFSHSLILLKSWCLFKLFKEQSVGEKIQRPGFLQHLDAYQLFSVPLLQDVPGFQQKGQKVTISLVYSMPGAHSLLDPSNV